MVPYRTQAAAADHPSGGVPDGGVALARRLEDQADPARVCRRRERVGDRVLLAPAGDSAVEREAQADAISVLFPDPVGPVSAKSW